MNKNISSSSDEDDIFFLKPKKTKTTKIKKNHPKKNKNKDNDFMMTELEDLNIDESQNLKNDINKNINITNEINIRSNKENIAKQQIKNNRDNIPNKNIIYSYIKIDKNNKLIKMTNKDINSTEKILASFKETKKKIDSINSIVIPFLEKIGPNCEGDPINISKFISKEISKTQAINKNVSEKCINYFFSLRYDLLYSTYFYLSRKSIIYLGYLLCYTYKKFHYYSIKDANHFSCLAKKTLEKREDALIDYYNSINEINEIDEVDETEKNESCKKMEFWKKNRGKYLVPPEINFLINRFAKIETCEIEVDFQGININSNDFNIISIFLLNINFLFVNLKHLKINFMNQKLQYEIYTSYFHDLLSSTQINKNIIKKNKNINPELLYDKKWNFKDKFNIKEYRLIRKKKLYKEGFNKQNLIFDEYNLLYVNYFKKEIKSEQMLNSAIQKTRQIEGDSQINKVKNNNINIMRHKMNIEKNKIKIKNIIKDKKNYSDIIKNSENILNLIAIMICSIGRLTDINGLEIIMNESYNMEFITNLVNLYEIDEDLIDIDFHILDLIYNKLKTLEQLNIEINSLDQLTFNKMLNLIYKNNNLITLNVSFFSSDITYFRRPLLKLYNQIIGGAEKLIKYNDTKIEEIILNSLLPFFVENLSVLFFIIKNLQKLENLGLNFDLPSTLLIQQNYIMSILKFILNILFLINNNNCIINKLTILARSIVLDERILPDINKLFSEFDINNSDNCLEELNLQFQFYNIVDIKNLISIKLIELNLGDLDFISFKSLVKYLTSYSFSSKSNLKIISIRLSNSISSLNTELKFILRELFYIKLANISEINIYTNINIKNETDYRYLINILKDNWTPDYTITFNSQSNEILNKCENLKSNIYFFVPDNKNEAFYCLKYLLGKKYMNSSMNFITIKNCISSILKYLYHKKVIKINHSLENKINNEKKT